MNKLYLVLVFVFLFVAGCGCTRIEPGHVGLKINMSGSQRGVDELPLQTGWVFYMPGLSRVFEYPTYMQTAAWTKDDTEESPGNEEISFNSKEGLIITGDISLSYQLEPKKIPTFYTKFRSDDLRTFTHGFLKNIARDIFNEAAGKYSVEDIYGPKKEEFLAEIRKRIGDEIKPLGVILEQFGFIGAPRPPANVVAALNMKVAATQAAIQSENELRQAEAEAKKNVARATGDANARMMRAEAEAKANKLIALSITPELVRYLSVTKWDGVLPKVTGGAMPMVQLENTK